MSTNLGEFQQLVMLAVARLGPDESFGKSLQKELEEVAGRSVTVGAVYVTLVRLEEQGLLTSVTAESIGVGRPRRLFELSPEGWDALRTTRSSLERMWDGIEIGGSA